MTMILKTWYFHLQTFFLNRKCSTKLIEHGNLRIIITKCILINNCQQRPGIKFPRGLLQNFQDATFGEMKNNWLVKAFASFLVNFGFDPSKIWRTIECMILSISPDFWAAFVQRWFVCMSLSRDAKSSCNYLSAKSHRCRNDKDDLEPRCWYRIEAIGWNISHDKNYPRIILDYQKKNTFDDTLKP